jgi:hypothetical protein
MMSSIDESFSRIARASASSAEYRSRLDPSELCFEPPEGDFESPEVDIYKKKIVKNDYSLLLTVREVVLGFFDEDFSQNSVFR